MSCNLVTSRRWPRIETIRFTSWYRLVILFAFSAQALAVQDDRESCLRRARIESPVVWRY